MFRKFLAFLPLAGILAACSSGVVDTWDPEKEIEKELAKKEVCIKMISNPTHKYYGTKFHFDGKDLYQLLPQYDNTCVHSGRIGETRIEDDGKKSKLVMSGNDIIYFKESRNGTYKEVYTSLR